jgi:hypothetical protein
VSNGSNTSQKIWQEFFARGYFVLTFEFTDQTGKTFTAKKKGRGWSTNPPARWVLEPGESIVYEIYFADSNTWTGFPNPAEGEKVVVSMRTVFEIPPTDDSAQLGVWAGRVVSEAQKITFYRPRR